MLVHCGESRPLVSNMMSRVLTSTLSAMAVFGQVPDLREGDCVRALEDIDYEHMPKAKKGYRGMVTGKGIIWEGRHWKFDVSGKEKQYLFKQRNAVIHRSMVEKMSETEGYGPIQNANGQCLTVFELEAFQDRTPQSAKLQWWDCEPGWSAQIFIYPACGFGPGQIRWATDPQMCAYRQIANQKLVLSQCEWTQPFIFAVVGDAATVPNTEGALNANNDPNNPDLLIGQIPDGSPQPGTATIQGFLKVGVTDTRENGKGANDPAKKDDPPQCFSTTNSVQDQTKIGDSEKRPLCPPGQTFLTFKGMWHATDLDIV